MLLPAPLNERDVRGAVWGCCFLPVFVDLLFCGEAEVARRDGEDDAARCIARIFVICFPVRKRKRKRRARQRHGQTRGPPRLCGRRRHL